MEKDIHMTIKPELLVIGGSAGSLEVLLKILPSLREDWSLSMIIVLHRKNESDSTLTDLLAAKTLLPVKEAEEKDVLTPGNIYIVPPDYHLLIEPDRSLTLDASEKVNYSRPSIDVTFISAAEVFGPKLVCLLLSGANADGALGMRMVCETGGFAAVLDPEEAEVPYMPRQAMEATPVNRVLSLKAIPAFVNGLQQGL